MASNGTDTETTRSQDSVRSQSSSRSPTPPPAQTLRRSARTRRSAANVELTRTAEPSTRQPVGHRPQRARRGRGRGRPASSAMVASSSESSPERSTTTTRRGRGRAAQQKPSLRQKIQKDVTAQTKQLGSIKKHLKKLSRQQLEEMVEELAELQPHIIFHVLQKLEGDDPQPPPPGPANQPDWCRCGYCRPMPTEVERRCCGKRPENCLSRLQVMDEVVLHRQVLELARRHRNELLAEHETVEDLNRSFRHTAYRQWVLLKYGKLGQGDRRVIPSCCVWRIRDTFPDPSGQYIGFKEAVRRFGNGD